MFLSMIKRQKMVISFAIIVIALFSISLTTCDSPLGFGDSIDWEPPVLTLDPGLGNPRYVRLGTKLTGTVTDNVAVARVILRESGTTNELFRAKIDGIFWEMELNFDESRNGERLAVEVVAYDRAGNSGETSIAALSIIVDLSPPVIDDAWIQRTPSNEQNYAFESLSTLKGLEASDPLGEISRNVNRYQNGWFEVNAQLYDEETRIDKDNITLKIYDVTFDNEIDLDNPLWTSGSYNGSESKPSWLVKEEDLLEAGRTKLAGRFDYETNYSESGHRYYYYVVIDAWDRAENSSYKEEVGFFCLWKTADEPKAVFDPVLGRTIVRGTPLPVNFFDDDSIDTAYMALFTQGQWENFSGATNEAKMLTVQNLLNAGTQQVLDYASTAVTKQAINGRIDFWEYINPGNNDYGNFVLFTMITDKKLDPHQTGTNSAAPITKTRYYELAIVDDNVPLVVFDTVNTTETDYDPDKHLGSTVNEAILAARTGNSPERNTFPKLTGGQYFDINGYILRDNTSWYNASEGGTQNTSVTKNGIVEFRMAWIPDGLPGTNAEKERAVKDALEANSGYPAGVQYWNWDASGGTSGDGGLALIEGTAQPIGTNASGDPTGWYRKQVFSKTFDILGGQDANKTGYNNFNYNGFENKPKLFVVYARDNMGNIVTETLRLLGNTTPPQLTVYDLSGANTPTLNPPSRNSYATDDLYNAALKTYQATAYPIIAGVSGSASDSNRTTSYQMYARGSTLKYWVTAANSGDIAVDIIQMDNITDVTRLNDVGYYNTTNRNLTYVESLPEVIQKVFYFVAEDKLGNRSELQRTVAVTSTAFLDEISTTSADGSYGIGSTITLQAAFSGQVKWNSPNTSTLKPQLNVRYPLADGTYQIVQLDTTTPANTDAVFLTFEFTVPQNASGKLESMYNDPAKMNGAGYLVGRTDRPLYLPDGVTIEDSTRSGDEAFVPGYGQSVEEWVDDVNSLQITKTIMLDGVRPVITGLTLSGKSPYTTGRYYFKGDETIYFTLTTGGSGKAIQTGGNGNPRIQFTSGGNTYYASYERPDGSNGMLFSVDASTVADGTILNTESNPTIGNITLNTANGTIVDGVGNALASTTLPALQANSTAVSLLVVDKTPPPAPLAEYYVGNGFVTANSTTAGNYNTNPILFIPASGTIADVEPQGVTTQYSLNNGSTWVNYPDARYTTDYPWTTATTTTADISRGPLFINNGNWILQTRYTDPAGNIGAVTSREINVNNKFPDVITANVEQPDGWYTSGTLNFTLEFDDLVSVTTANTVSITLSDRSLTGTSGGGGLRSKTLYASTSSNSSSVNFSWNLSTETGYYEMPNSLYVSQVTLTSLRDRYGNTGGSLNATIAGGISSNAGQTSAGDNLYGSSLASGAGVKVDNCNPTVTSTSPVNAQGRSGNITTSVTGTARNTITITFHENVAAGNGAITIKPHGTYNIPAVFENEGYYNSEGTWIAGLSDIYNNSSLNATDRGYLTAGSNLGSGLDLKPRTGQSAGPYMRTTQGLRSGAGYSGNYNNTTPAANGPSPDGTFMIPDTSQKWVLDYQYAINGNVTAVTNIRNTLNKAGFRQQQINATDSNVTINGAVVTITLEQPLLEGLQWDIYYPSGTFTDQAGNPTAAIAEGAHWFWSSGVQTPVIRVNRRSYDARAIGTGTTPNNLSAASTRTYSNPADTTNWNTDTIAITDSNGWGIGDFNTVHYRVESETPGARISYGTIDNNSTTFTGPTQTNGLAIGRIWIVNDTGTTNPSTSPTRDWAVDTNVTNGGTAAGTDAAAWSATGATNGTWVLPNLVRRAGNGSGSYTVTESGAQITRTFQGDYRGFRSYNKDATSGELAGITVADSQATVSIQRRFTYTAATEASKNYVAAQAFVDHVNATYATATYSSARGYEGVFRSVVALNDQTNDNSLNIVEGSNVKNGMPSIAGFPVRDAEETGDNRFIKMFYWVGSNKRCFWVSTEIVSQWYFIMWGNGGSHQSSGEANNYLTAGYGDLAFARVTHY